MAEPAPLRRSLDELDFLSLPLAESEGVKRVEDGFAVETPWALARFGRLVLRGGWWALEWSGDADPACVEVRLSSPGHPLVIAPGDAAKTFRLHLQDGAEWRVSLLVSAWPGVAKFTVLRMRRLSRIEEFGLMAAGVQRLLKSDRPVERLWRAAARVLSGRTVGVRTADAQPASAPSVGSAPRGEARIMEKDSVLAVLGPGGDLHPRAFDLVAAAFARDPGLRAIYADVDEGGVITPKPCWDPELGKRHDIAGTPLFLRAGETLRTAQDIARTYGAAALHRIPLPLARRTGAAASPLERPPAPPLPPDRQQWPKVTALVPTKFRVDLLEACLNGLAQSTDYPDLDVVVIDNGSTDPRFPAVIDAASRRLNLKLIRDDRPFNFPSLIASGAAHATGEIILLLNDDVEAREPGWLHRMVASALEPDVGAVGARLLYPDGSVQHAGAIMGLGGVCGHMWKGASAEEQACNPYIALPGGRMAVTGACLAVRRDAFDRVGGLDAEAFPVALNDIDFCLRLHAAGLRTVYRGDAVLVHHESQSRGADDANEARRRRLEVETARFMDRWEPLLAGDPFGSPAFDPLDEAGRAHKSLRRQTG